MSTLDNKQVWSDLTRENISSKYEKCRNITEEIYKRINITFQIKKLENAGQSDVSEHSDFVDSNDLSNETDLFACDKTDSLPSSEEKNEFVNINNNVEPRVKDVKKVTVHRRPRKRFRKRVKKHQSKSKATDSDGSSDEAPLSRIIDTQCVADSPESVMGVPGVIIITKDVKPRTHSPEKKTKRTTHTQKDQKTNSAQSIEKDSKNKKGGKQTIDKTENTPTCEKSTIETEKSLKIIIDKTEVEKMIIDTLATKSPKITNVIDDKKLEKPKDKIEQRVEKMIIDTLAVKSPTIVDEKQKMMGEPIDKAEVNTVEQSANLDVKKKPFVESKPCTLCSLTFRGERGLRRHMAMTHIISEETKPARPDREVKPA